MAAFSGTAGSVSSFSSPSLMTGITEWSLDLSMSPPETTEFGQANDTFVPSVRTGTGSFSGSWSDSLTGGEAIVLADMLGGIGFRLDLWENSARSWTLGTCFLTGISNTVSVKGKSEISYNFQAQGIVSYS